MPLPTKASDVSVTALKIEDAYGTRREIDVVSLRFRDVSVRMHIDHESLHDLISDRIGLKAGSMLTVQDDQHVAVELTPLANAVTLILDRGQVNDLRDQCRKAMGEIEFGDVWNCGA